jgi:hypothetical protein
VKKHTPQIVIYAIAILLAARLTWTAAQHHMPTLDTLTIGVFALYGTHAGVTNMHRAIQAARTPKATR